MSQRVSLDALNKADKAEFVRLLDGMFEGAPWVAEATFSGRPFATVASLHDAMMAAVRGRAKPDQIAFVSGHPDLPAKPRAPVPSRRSRSRSRLVSASTGFPMTNFSASKS